MDRETMMKTMGEATSNVLETMFYQPIHITDTNCSLQEWFSDTQLLVGATLSFHGPSKGSFYLLLPATMVAGITANFLGIEEEEINEEQKKDVVKEALNMIVGNTLSLFDKEGAFTLGIPELIEENELAEDNLGGLMGGVILIETEENHLAAGIMIETGNWKLGWTMKEVYELDVYKLAEELSDMIWYAFDEWSEKAQKTIGYQIIRSSDSIASNLAEGYGRFTPADRKTFYRYSRGSFEETKAWLRKLIRRNVISDNEITKYTEIIDELGPKLNAFIRSTK